MQKPIIVHIITALHTGGAERMLAGLSHAWAGKAEFHVVYFKNVETTKPLFHTSTIFHRLSLSPWIIWRLRILLKAAKPDVIHTHLGHADLLGHASAIGIKSHKWVTMHNAAFRQGWQDGLFFIFYKLLFRYVSKHVSFVAISKSVASFLEKSIGIAPARVHLVYNPLSQVKPYGKVEAKAQLACPTDATLLLALGRLEYQKAPDLLVEAIAFLPIDYQKHIKLIFAGEGSLKSSLERRVATLGLSDVISFAGLISHPSLHLHAADALVLPSRFEGFGNVILEAYSAGTPVLASALEGPRELIVNGETGFLFIPANSQAIAEAISTFIQVTPERRRSMRDKAIAIARSWQTPQTYADTLWHLYFK